MVPFSIFLQRMENNKKGYNRRDGGRKPQREEGEPRFASKSKSGSRSFNPQKSKPKNELTAKQQVFKDGEIRLNKYIANSGLCSRREADKLIESSKVAVNGKIVTELGYKVLLTDKVHVNGKAIIPEKKVYVLLNKPKDVVTTMGDPEGRKTVLDLIDGCCLERIYPVGRLDRMTTGVMLLTNDGELTTKLTHPKYNQRKVYQAFVNKPFTHADMAKLAEGITLEDGFIAPDAISYVGNDQTQIGLQIHSGRNRIVRRMFEHLGYEVEKLDRVYFAGLTKKGIPRGKWRFLRPSEISRLKMNNFS